jgi:hypothetical protein
VAFHAQLDSYRGKLDARVRAKVREAYRIMGFRPGGGGGGGSGAASAVEAEQATLVAAAQMQQQRQEQKSLKWGRQGAMEGSGPGRGGAPAQGVGVGFGVGQSDPQGGRRVTDGCSVPDLAYGSSGQTPERAGELESQQAESEDGPAIDPAGVQLQSRRRAPAPGRGGQGSGIQGAAEAAEDSSAQVLVRPSRFMF